MSWKWPIWKRSHIDSIESHRHCTTTLTTRTTEWVQNINKRLRFTRWSTQPTSQSAQNGTSTSTTPSYMRPSGKFHKRRTSTTLTHTGGHTPFVPSLQVDTPGRSQQNPDQDEHRKHPAEDTGTHQSTILFSSVWWPSTPARRSTLCAPHSSYRLLGSTWSKLHHDNIVMVRTHGPRGP